MGESFPVLSTYISPAETKKEKRVSASAESNPDIEGDGALNWHKKTPVNKSPFEVRRKRGYKALLQHFRLFLWEK